MRKAIFWGFLGTLAEPPPVPRSVVFDPAQYRVYPRRGRYIGCAPIRAFGTTCWFGISPRCRCLACVWNLFFRIEWSLWQGRAGGKHGRRIFRRARAGCPFSTERLVCQRPEELNRAKEAGWAYRRFTARGRAELTCPTPSQPCVACCNERKRKEILRRF